MTYTVVGYYSPSDYDFNPEFIDEFDSQEEADECKKDFETVSGRLAWVETN